MNMIFKWIPLLAFLFFSCSEDKVLPIDSPSDVSGSNSPNTEAETESRFRSNDRTEEEIINDFPKPINTYPLIEKKDVEILNGGILYRLPLSLSHRFCVPRRLPSLPLFPPPPHSSWVPCAAVRRYHTTPASEPTLEPATTTWSSCMSPSRKAWPWVTSSTCCPRA